MAEDGVFRFERWRIVPDEECNWSETSENQSCDREAHENGERGLFKGKTSAQNLRDHSVNQRVSATGQENEQWKFDSGEERLERRAPNSEGEPVHPRANQNYAAISKN